MRNKVNSKFAYGLWLSIGYIAYAQAIDSSSIKTINPTSAGTSASSFTVSQGNNFKISISQGTGGTFFGSSITYTFYFQKCPTNYTPFGVAVLGNIFEVVNHPACGAFPCTIHDAYFDPTSVGTVPGTSFSKINLVLTTTWGNCCVGGNVYIDYNISCVPCGWYAAQIGSTKPPTGLPAASSSSTLYSVPIICR